MRSKKEFSQYSMISILKNHFSILFGVLTIILSGYFGGIIAASAVSIIALLIFTELDRIFFLLVLFLLVFFVADNFRGPLAFAQDFRFIIIALAFIILAQYFIFISNKGKWLIVFTSFAFIVTLLFSPLGTPAILRTFGYLAIGLLIFKLTSILLQTDRQRLISLLFASIFLFFITNLLLFFFPFYSDSFSGGRFSGLMANPNGLGLLAMFCYAVVEWIRNKEEVNITKSVYLVFKLILIFLIVISASRTALIGVIGFELTNRFLQYQVLLVIGLAGIAFTSVLLNNIETEEIIRSLGLSDYLRVQTLETASGRTEVWQVAFHEFQQHPWFGQGMMYDNYFIDQYAEQRFGENYARQWNGVWNSYLSLALNVGIIGLTLFGYFWYRLFKSAKDRVFRVAFLVMILLSAITESWMAASMNAFMPLVFLIWALQIEPNYQIEEV